MESPKGPTKESKTASKILITSQNSSHCLQNSNWKTNFKPFPSKLKKNLKTQG